MTLARSLEKTAGGQDTSWSSGKKQNAAQVVRANLGEETSKGTWAQLCSGSGEASGVVGHAEASSGQEPGLSWGWGGGGVLVGPRVTAERPPASPVTWRHTALPGAAAQQGEGGQG